jgi:S1-C subfamily serine protease
VGVVHPGNSGGPLVGSDGRVLATVFAGTVGASTPGGYGVANSSVAAVLAQAQAHERAGLQASTEGCANG